MAKNASTPATRALRLLARLPALCGSSSDSLGSLVARRTSLSAFTAKTTAVSATSPLPSSNPRSAWPRPTYINSAPSKTALISADGPPTHYALAPALYSMAWGSPIPRSSFSFVGNPTLSSSTFAISQDSPTSRTTRLMTHLLCPILFNSVSFFWSL
jgi:hypothetical protein